MKPPYLSVIIPAHDEERRLPQTLVQVFDFLSNQAFEWEVIVIENGSSDDTYKVALSFQQSYPNLVVLSEKQAGKGLAVRRGMLYARGVYRFMCDADLSMPVEQILRFLPPECEGYDIAIGSREAPGSVRYNEPFHRHWGGRLINLVIRGLALPGLKDTQCGFKCFRAEIAQDLFSSQVLDGWAFDVEVLYIARMRGYNIVEVPIDWYFNPETKLKPFSDAIHMALDVWRIRRNAKSGYYAK